MTPDLDAYIDPSEIPEAVPYVETDCVTDDPTANLDIWTADFLASAPPALAMAAAGEFAPAALSRIYGWIDPHYSSMKRSGIVGNAAHLAGYHRSRQRLLNVGRSGDYSIQAPADKRGERWACCGIDISFGDREMKIATRRLMNACRPDSDGDYDPRIEPIREFFGTLDGDRVTGWNRYPSSNRRVGYTTSDKSHLWHVHISMFRDYADDADKMRAVADVLNGVPLKPAPKPPTPPAPKPPEEDDMPTAQEVANAVLTAKIGTGAVDDWTLKHLIDWTARTTKVQGDALGKVITMLGQISAGQKVTQADIDEVQAVLAELEDEPEPEEPPA